MRTTRLSLALCLALAVLAAGPALAQGEAPKQEPSAPAQGQDAAQDKAKKKILLMEKDTAAREALDSLQGKSHDRGDGGHGGPSAGFGGMGPGHGGGAGPHR